MAVRPIQIDISRGVGNLHWSLVSKGLGGKERLEVKGKGGCFWKSTTGRPPKSINLVHRVVYKKRGGEFPFSIGPLVVWIDFSINQKPTPPRAKTSEKFQQGKRFEKIYGAAGCGWNWKPQLGTKQGLCSPRKFQRSCTRYYPCTSLRVPLEGFLKLLISKSHLNIEAK